MNKIRYSIDRIKLSFYTAMALLDNEDKETEEAISNIENAFKELKRLEQIDIILEDFKLTNLQNLIDTLNNIEFLERQNTINLKKLKALEIIKNKRVDIICLLHAFKDKNGCYFYNYYREEFSYELMEEEYNLLKEVFKEN